MTLAAVDGYVLAYLISCAALAFLTWRVLAAEQSPARRRIALHPDRYAYRCDRHREPVYGRDRDTAGEAEQDWREHDARDHRC